MNKELSEYILATLVQKKNLAIDSQSDKKSLCVYLGDNSGNVRKIIFLNIERLYV